MNFHERFKLLAVFHYVFAGMAALFGCFPMLYVVFGILIFTGSLGGAPQNAPPPMIGLMMAGFGAAASVLVWALAAATAMCGYYLHVQRNYLFCLIVAAIETMNMPIGTALGVCTIITLADEKGKAMFGRPDSSEPESTTTAP